MDKNQQKHKIKSLDGTGTFDESTGNWAFEQDHRPFVEQAKMERERTAKRDVGYKKACTIPTVVQLEILNKYGINIMDDNFMHDSEKVKKVLNIIKHEYPYLMSY